MRGDDIVGRLSCETPDPNAPAQWVSSTIKNSAEPIWNQGVKLNATGDTCWMHVHECDKNSNNKWCNGDLIPNKKTEYLGTYPIAVKDATSSNLHVSKNCGNKRKEGAGCGWIWYSTEIGNLDTQKSWQCMGLTNQGSLYFGKHLLIPKGDKNAKLLCEALSCLCDVDPSHKSGSCMSRLDDQNKQTNQLWQQVMKEKMHDPLL
jgi:hypothetical protein